MAGQSSEKVLDSFIGWTSKSLINYTFYGETDHPREYDPFESYTPLWLLKPPVFIDDNIAQTFALGEPGINRNSRKYDYDYLFNNLYMRHLFGGGRGGRRILFDGEEIMFFKYLLHITHNNDRSNLRKICNINIDRLYDIVYTYIDKLKLIEKRNLIKLTGYKINMEVY